MITIDEKILEVWIADLDERIRQADPNGNDIHWLLGRRDGYRNILEFHTN